MMNFKFPGFLDPVLNQIDNGNFFRKPFYWLYVIIAVLNPIGALFFLYQAIDSGMLKYMRGGAVVMFVIFWIILFAVSILAFLLWWNRKDKVREVADQKDNFVAIPVITHLIQTAGEWAGLMIATLGFAGTLLTLASGDLRHLVPVEYGVLGLVLYPVAGFLVVVVARFLAEAWRALADIANNTKRTAESLPRHGNS